MELGETEKPTGNVGTSQEGPTEQYKKGQADFSEGWHVGKEGRRQRGSPLSDVLSIV